jgi:imidazolonepropionase-like amidohydrolase
MGVRAAAMQFPAFKLASLGIARIALCVAAVCGALLGLSCTSPVGARPATAIVHVNVLEGRGDPAIRDAFVLVRDGRIEQVGTGAPPPGADIVEGNGGWLLPGFIDMHAHLLVPRCERGPDGSIFDRAVSEQVIGALLDFGVTTVRSPATPTVEGLRLRDDLNAGRVRGPRAFASAELINDPNLTADQIRQLVRDALPHRPDYYKAYSRLGAEQVRALVEEAHAHGVPVIGHLGQTSWRDGADLGIDYLTHAVDWSEGSLPAASREAYRRAIAARGPIRARIDWLELFDANSAEAAATIDALLRNNISVDPTLIAYDTKFAAPNGGSYADNRFVNIVPALHDDWRACMRITSDWSAEDYRRWGAAWPKMLAWVRLMHARGVMLTTGTDLTNPWVIPGESLHQEFALLHQAGLAPGEILRMTGENAARALRRPDIGLIAPGRRADLVLLRGDPMADIENTRTIVWVMQGGTIVSRGPTPAG